MYKMVAIDMDGTLLNDQSEITYETIKTILRTQKDFDVKVVPVTGRAYYTIEDIVRILELKDAVATQNGSIVVNPVDESILFENLISAETTSEIIEFAQKNGFKPLLYLQDKVYGRLQGKYLDIFENTMRMKVDYIEDIFQVYNDEPVGKVLFLDEPDKLKVVEDWLNANHEGKMHAAYSYDFALEIGAVDKGKVMLQIADNFGILPEEIIAIGDGHSDISMLKEAGLAVAMDNAMDIVKDLCDYTTKSNNDNGVAYAIEKFVIKRK